VNSTISQKVKPSEEEHIYFWIKRRLFMKRQKIGTFNNLKNGDLIISPIDNEVTQFYIDKDGLKYLSGKTSLFAIFQFDANDFYYYDGKKKCGEVDNCYFC
jgi:hypothetical protein